MESPPDSPGYGGGWRAGDRAKREKTSKMVCKNRNQGGVLRMAPPEMVADQIELTPENRLVEIPHGRRGRRPAPRPERIQTWLN